MVVAAAGMLISGITLASGTATFLMFIHEEAVQTAMMSHYIAHKNKMVDTARELIKKAANRYLMRAVVFTRERGWLAPYAVHSFKTYWQATLDMLEVYARHYDVDISEQAETMRDIIAQPLIVLEVRVADTNLAESKEDVRKTIEDKTYDCDVLAHIEAMGKEPKDKASMGVYRTLGHGRRVMQGEYSSALKGSTEKGKAECERRREELGMMAPTVLEPEKPAGITKPELTATERESIRWLIEEGHHGPHELTTVDKNRLRWLWEQRDTKLWHIEQRHIDRLAAWAKAGDLG